MDELPQRCVYARSRRRGNAVLTISLLRGETLIERTGMHHKRSEQLYTCMSIDSLKDRYLLAVLVLSTLMLSFSVIKPLGYDNSLVQSMALDLYRMGHVPYVGTWLHDLPGIVY